MTSAILFAFLVVACVFQTIHAGPLDTLRMQLQQAQNKVSSITSDLSRTSNNLRFTTKSKISGKKSEYYGNINNFVNPALNQIRSDVDAAKAEGKDAEHCYNTAKDSLRTVSLDGFAALDQCEREAQSVLDQALSVLDVHEATGQRLLAELNTIFPNCYSSNIMQMQSCIAIKLGMTNQQIRSYESDVSSAKTKANSSTFNAVMSISNCGMKHMNTVRAGTTDARIAANNCVKSA